MEELDNAVGPFDVAWATHALYSLRPGAVRAAAARMLAALGLIWIAYLIGQLGNWLPVPGGIGGVELGLVGALVLYGLPALTATAAVLLYRVIELWIPAVLGIAAFVQLRLLQGERPRRSDCARRATP